MKVSNIKLEEYTALYIYI